MKTYTYKTTIYFGTGEGEFQARYNDHKIYSHRTDEIATDLSTPLSLVTLIFL